MMITMQGEHGELSPHHGVKTAKLNIWIRVLLLDWLENSCKARFPTAGEIARAKRLCRHTLADVMSNADKGESSYTWTNSPYGKQPVIGSFL